MPHSSQGPSASRAVLCRPRVRTHPPASVGGQPLLWPRAPILGDHGEGLLGRQSLQLLTAHFSDLLAGNRLVSSPDSPTQSSRHSPGAAPEPTPQVSLPRRADCAGRGPRPGPASHLVAACTWHHQSAGPQPQDIPGSGASPVSLTRQLLLSPLGTQLGTAPRYRPSRRLALPCSRQEEGDQPHQGTSS